MKLGLVANPEIPEAIRVARRVFDLLSNEEIVLEAGLARAFGKKGKAIRDMKGIEALITVGGDGTMLRSMQSSTVPVFGINAGMLGFLTAISEEDQIESGLKRLIQRRYFVDERIRLKTMMSGKRVPDGLNEAVIHTAHIAKIRSFRVYVDDLLAMDVRADGIIVATPTGSTSYSMSVGGPIIDPRVEAFVISAMAPFKHFARPIVVPPKSTIRVELTKPRPCYLVIDGQSEIEMEGDEVVEFSLSEKNGRIISFDRDFYSKLKEKLMGVP